MNGSNGISGALCKWCGKAERIESNEYCSPDCYYASHDEDQLYQLFCSDRASLTIALRGIDATIAELNESLHKDGPSGELAHAEILQSIGSMRREAAQIGAKIQELSEKIAQIERGS